MGCGRVGSTLAVSLSNRGHSVSIIDQDSDAFRRLPEDFDGQRVTGVGFDRGALRQAGIEEAHGFAAVSSGDNSNIIAARVVRDTFGIKNVVTRIYDPSRAQVYERLGIDTVPTVKWTADQMLRSLIPLGPHVEYIDSANGMAMFLVDLDSSWFGLSVADVERATNARVAFISRHGNGVVPTSSTIIQDGDAVRVLGPQTKANAIQRILNHPVKEKDL